MRYLHITEPYLIKYFDIDRLKINNQLFDAIEELPPEMRTVSPIADENTLNTTLIYTIRNSWEI